MRRWPRRVRWVAGLLALAIIATGCRRPGDGGYELSACFERAVALFEQSRVKVMGADVGLVNSIEIDGDQVCVRMQIDAEVPLPADVQAAILPLTLIGERNILLFPPWQPGDDLIEPGTRIENTRVPVEPDDVLDALTELVNAIDPERVEAFLADAAAAVDGRGEAFNNAVRQGARLTQVIAERDQQLLAVADTLRQLAERLNTRDAQLRRLISTYAATTKVLAEERAAIEQFIEATARLMDEGAILIESYEEHLAEDLAQIAEIALVMRANVASLDQFIAALPPVADVLRKGHDPETHSIVIRVSGGPVFNELLADLLAAMGVDPICIELPDTTCE
ncbi:MAG: MlaD family protein [Nitriliruptorales bacterium]|nr:MlaD family protein [Nitriliruptorales bacterium]